MSDELRQRIPMPRQRCLHLTCKGMQIYGDHYLTPVNEMDRTNDFWCQQTHNVLGPDGALVMLSQCSPSRECYEAL